MQVPTYNTLVEKSVLFPQSSVQQYWQIKTKEEFEQFYTMLQRSSTSTIYRGVYQAKYKNFTSLQRAYMDGKIDSHTSPSGFIANEIEHLKNDKPAILQRYYNALNLVDTDFIYLSFLQHHKAPTPFLDFSRKLDVALYFATEDLIFGKGEEIDDYCSIYWLDYKKPQFCGLMDIVTWYAQQYQSAIGMLSHLYEIHRGEHMDIDVSNLEIENYLKWSNPHNNGEGLCKIPIGLMTEPKEKFEIKYTAISMHRRLAVLQSYAQRGLLTQNMVETFKKHMRNCIFQNARLTNLNIAAQDGCFILMNNNDPQNQKSLEDEFTAKPYYPILHCANIHKSLGEYIINKIHNGANKITKSTIYPNGDEMALLAFNQTRINNI